MPTAITPIEDKYYEHKMHFKLFLLNATALQQSIILGVHVNTNL